MKGLTYAVGDIHGRYDLLNAMLNWIAGDSRHQVGTTIIFLGDYVDRGPQSNLVIERLMHGPARADDRLVCLMGNHEEMLVDAHQKPDVLREAWLSNGGEQTLASYGGAVPVDHLEWMKSLPLNYSDDHRFFVHAGVNPTRTLAAQTQFDMLWIRDRFLKGSHDVGKHVVHGHTPIENGPDLRPYRTNLDVGAVWNDRLCVGVFDPDVPGGPIQTHLIRV